MKRIIFATGNEGKMKEIRMILADLQVPVLSMKEAGLQTDVEENGKSFAENADIKATAIQKLSPEDIVLADDSGPGITGQIVLADDSGLEVDALDKAPGIYSARYMGEDTSYRIKNANLVERLNGVPDEKRTARFVCAISAALPGGTILRSRGTIEGRIGYEERGENGFGYDPIFYLPEYGCSTAELDPATKNRLSHRGKALEAIKEQLRPFLEEGNR